MPDRRSYPEKFERIARQTPFPHLPRHTRGHVRRLAHHYRFTLQELRTVTEIAQDLAMWRTELSGLWPLDGEEGREAKKSRLRNLQRQWQRLKHEPNRYRGVAAVALPKPVARERDKGGLGLGTCPVASPRTRCCNLLTLDAVDNCGYGCSYCSIQSFFSGHEVFFDPRFGERLEALEIDPERIYHIGTGQSSDSLMWGNSHGVLDALIAFARRHPNVILELKTKSANIGHLLRRPLPPNLLCTWSLNPPLIVDHEEHGTASLQKRLQAAERLARKGVIVGFHLHPMVHFDGWQQAYGDLIDQLQRRFDPADVAMVSLGTLTFIRPVIRRIRERGLDSQILKLPLEETNGKLSYPEAVKRELFRHAWNCFAPSWREQVFFYLCMESDALWQPVFGHSYPDNLAFEAAMKRHYMEKILSRVRSGRD